MAYRVVITAAKYGERCGIPIGEINYRTDAESVAEAGIKTWNINKQEKGYGSQFLKMLISCLFEQMGYQKIVLEHKSFVTVALRNNVFPILKAINADYFVIYADYVMDYFDANNN